MERWSEDKIEMWYAEQPWFVGCNFIPSTAVNQLEMWQAESFDPSTIKSELTLASSLGMNAVRVYLHDLVWLDDAEGFKQRIHTFLEIAFSLGIKTMLVLFDDCWFPDPHTGKQSSPIPGHHNSQWANSPGPAAACDPDQDERLKAYVQDIVSHFSQDERIILWDIYNEVGNIFLPTLAKPWYIKIPRLFWSYPLFKMGYIPTLKLLEKTAQWVREINPSQPLTSSVYVDNKKLNRVLLEISDIISFHNYEDPESLAAQINELKKLGRPLLCSEYLNRLENSHFETFLPLFKKEKIGCFNWGLVSGKTQTIFSWQNPMTGSEEPEIWFHDILRKDGSPYDIREVEFIKKMTNRNSSS